MKKSSVQFIFIVALVLTSLSSYIYISTLAADQSISTKCNLKHQIEAVEAEAEHEQAVILPEAEVIKKLSETGKRILPATGSF